VNDCYNFKLKTVVSGLFFTEFSYGLTAFFYKGMKFYGDVLGMPLSSQHISPTSRILIVSFTCLIMCAFE